MLPLAFDLKGRRTLVLGAGKVGAHKARQLVDVGATVDVIAETVTAELPLGINSLCLRRFAIGDLGGYWLVVSAIGDPLVNDLVFAEALRLRIWLNVVDDPARSSFFFTALHRDGDIVVSVSTQGSSPALAQILRDIVAKALPKNASQVAQQLRNERRMVHLNGGSTENINWHPRVQSLLKDS